MWRLGQSLKDVAVRSPDALERMADNLAPSEIQHYEALWQTGKAPSEIKKVVTTMAHIENDTALSDSLRFLIPRAAYGMIYNIRSKKNAVEPIVDGIHIAAPATPQPVSLTVGHPAQAVFGGLLAHAKPNGLTRTAIGLAAKCKPPSVSTALSELTGKDKRQIHYSANKRYFITSAGEAALAAALSA